MTTELMLQREPGTAFMMSNEAMVRSALENGVRLVSSYPGSPTTEFIDVMSSFGPKVGVDVEVSSSEMVALESVAGAAMAGFRSMTSMKSVGLNVASDSFFSLAYTGVRGGMVIMVADDPFAHSSQTEQDGRLYAQAAYIPMIEPTSPQDAYQMVKDGFELSEEFQVPVILRTTTRVNHQSSLLRMGELKDLERKKNDWKDVGRNYITVGQIARELKVELLKRWDLLKEKVETSPWNRIHEGDGDVGLIVAGVPIEYTMEAMERLGVKLPMLTIQTLNPLPERMMAEFVKGKSKVLVIEELTPMVENAVLIASRGSGPSVEILGKRTGHFSEMLEYSVTIVEDVLSKVLGREPSFDATSYLEKAVKAKEAGKLEARIPTFCAGCPHRATLYGLQNAIKGKDVVISLDIGCYSMLKFPPFGLGDSLLCMGCSVGISAGKDRTLNDKVISIMGDSTLYHAGIPGIINAIHNKHDFMLLMLDNKVTAMTGQQSNPGSVFAMGRTDIGETILMEDMFRGLGVEPVLIDAFSPKQAVADVKEQLDRDGFRVLISKGPCALYNDRLKRRAGQPIVPYEVRRDKCVKCHTCMKMFYCPAISMHPEDRASRIDPTLCNGCGVCSTLCPFDVIHSTECGDEDAAYGCRAPAHEKVDEKEGSR